VRNPIYDFILPEERSNLCAFLSGGDDKNQISKQKYSSVVVSMRIGGLQEKEMEAKFHSVKLSGYMKPWISTDCQNFYLTIF